MPSSHIELSAKGEDLKYKNPRQRRRRNSIRRHSGDEHADFFRIDKELNRVAVGGAASAWPEEQTQISVDAVSVAEEGENTGNTS